jgi:hypothetical protein
MPRPLTPDGAAEPPTGPRTGSPAPADEVDSSGRELAMRLPEWDLVPPTEFLDRVQARGRVR